MNKICKCMPCYDLVHFNSTRKMSSDTIDTPKKIVEKAGCFACDTVITDSKLRTRLKGKDKELFDKVCELLKVPKSNFETGSQYLCRRCVSEVKKAHKLQEDLTNCLTRIKERFATNTRVKRGLPSDVSMQDIRAPALKMTRSEESQAIAPQPARAKRLNFKNIEKEILYPKENMPVILPMPVAERPIEVYEDVIACGNICKVEVSVTYENGKKVGKLQKDLHRLGKALARGSSYKCIADAVMSCKALQECIYDSICKVLSGESKSLTSKNNALLRYHKKDDILQFSWSNVCKELVEKAPLLYRVLMAVADAKSKHEAEKKAGISVAAGILLKLRDKGMSLIPYAMSLILKAGRVSKTGLIRLNHLGVCMSPKSTIKVLEEIGVGYEATLKNWQKDIEDHLESNKESTKDGQVQENGEDKVKETDIVRPPSYAIVLDNFDLKVSVADTTSDNQNKDYHWCNHNAVLDRVNPTELKNDAPIQDLEEVPNSSFIPDLEDQNALMKDFVILIARVFVANFKEFHIFQDIVPSHICHEHSEAMKKKSQKVNLGILFKDETLGDEMIDILRELHKWVPTVKDDENLMDTIPIVGDQKTIERGVEAQFSVSNAYSKERRLEGLCFQLADWHHENKFLALIFARFYSGSSAADKTSLFALRNQINWRDVVSDAEHKPAPCKRFLNLVLDAQIIAAGLKFFGMQSMSDKPTKEGFNAAMKDSSKTVKHMYLNKVVKKFISTFILDVNLYSTHRENILNQQIWENEQNNQAVNPDGRFPCRFGGCSKSFVYDGASRRRHELTHNPPPIIPEPPKLVSTAPTDLDPTKPKPKNDDVYNYHCSLLNMAILLRNFIDATREGDGPRIIRTIKFFLLHYRQDEQGSTKYALESLYHLFQLNALLTPYEAERLKWNRSVNNKGGSGNNVPFDLDLEHDNHLLKELCRGLGANITHASVDRISRSFAVTKGLLQRVDEEMAIRKTSGEHTKQDVNKDLKIIVQTLKDENVFEKQHTGRSMHAFPGCPRDYLELLDTKSLYKWINDHKKKIALGRRPR